METTHTKRRWIFLTAFLLLFVILLVSYVAWWNFEGRKEITSQPTPTTEAYFSIDLPRYSGASEEEKKWIDEHIFQVILKATEEYPIASVREELLHARASYVNEEFYITVTPASGLPTPVMAQTGWDQEKGVAVVAFHLKDVQEFHAQTQDQSVFEDTLISTYLHEVFHVIHHSASYDREGPVPYEERFQFESEAWWYTAETLLIPMLESGRLNEAYRAPGSAVDAYTQAAGDPTSEVWLDFVSMVTPKLD